MRALPFLERAQDAIVALLKDIKASNGDFTTPRTVTVSIAEDVWNRAKPCLVVNLSAHTMEAQVSEHYQSEATFDVWCLCDVGEREAGARQLLRLMSDVTKALGEGFRPDSGVFDSGHMFLAESIVDFPLSESKGCYVGRITVKCTYSWTADAP